MKRTHVLRLQLLILALILFFSITPTALATTTLADTDFSIEQQEIDTQHYYYNQLNKLEQKVYNTFTKSKADILANKSFSFLLGPLASKEAYVYSVSRARQAFILDDPQALIWFQNVQLSLTFENSNVFVWVKPKEAVGQYSDLSPEEFPDAYKAFEEKASELVKTLNGTDTQKLLQIYNWLIDNVKYDYTHNLPNARSAYGALINGIAVCSGFAYAYKYIADLAGLEVLYVTGTYQLNDATGYHAWNMAKVDGKWYFIDATWGATSSRIFRKHYFLASTDTKILSPDTLYFTYPS
ncbi:MAG: hypothetical protein HFJ29_01605 [Clostridia bacterium]|nr:hypothetical protein [Clostridia bacterium]